MNDSETTRFEIYRPLMFSIAYRMLGSATEAEDIVQEAFLRYQTTATDEINSHKAFLTTVVTRLCLNQLQSAHNQRENYIGPWLPEPVLTESDDRFAPAQQAELHDSLSMAFLTLLEQLTPLERAVFLLREVFDYEYAEIAEVTGKEEAACRQMLSRAKKHIAEHRPRFKPDPEAHRHMLTEFIEAVGTGELGGLMHMLSEDVTLWADGGGKARGAAIYPLHGREAVAQFVLGSTRFVQEQFYSELAEINGELSVIVRTASKVLVVLAINEDQGHVSEIRIVGNPDKLKWVSGALKNAEEENEETK
jgi:RNA polymerase sigma-70 factor (ECF subfamily)